MEDIVHGLEQMGPLEAEILSRVTTARVAFADYELLRDDFSELAGLDDEGIDRWLVSNTAFISHPQALQTTINAEIKTGPDYTIAFRPPGYGRAAIFSLAWNHRWLGPADTCTEGCLDVKGIGVAALRRPLLRPHGFGLLYFSLALREIIIERMVRRVFSHAREPILTARNYAVIDLGFDLVYPSQNPAALLVRQAYLRDHDLKQAGSLEDQLELRIERLLRRYGISSKIRTPWITVSNMPETGLRTMYGMPSEPMTGSQFAQFSEITGFKTGESIIYGINVQFTRGFRLNSGVVRLIDFGGFSIYEDFDDAVATLVGDRPLFLGQIVFPTDAGYVHPDPEIQLRIRMDDLNGLCEAVSRGFRQGLLSTAEVGDKVRASVEEGTSHLAHFH